MPNKTHKVGPILVLVLAVMTIYLISVFNRSIDKASKEQHSGIVNKSK